MLLEAKTTALNYLRIYCYLWSRSTVEKCGSGSWITYKQSNLPHLGRYWQQCLD